MPRVLTRRGADQSERNQSAMTCKFCKTGMKELKGHIYHGKRKWKCPRCSRVRMQAPKTSRPRPLR